MTTPYFRRGVGPSTAKPLDAYHSHPAEPLDVAHTHPDDDESPGLRQRRTELTHERMTQRLNPGGTIRERTDALYRRQQAIDRQRAVLPKRPPEPESPGLRLRRAQLSAAEVQERADRAGMPLLKRIFVPGWWNRMEGGRAGGSPQREQAQRAVERQEQVSAMIRAKRKLARP